MVDGIGMALTSLKAASELTQSLIKLRDTAKIGEISIELNGKIAAAQQLAIAAQGEQTALVREIDDLKKKIVEFENWTAEKERYQLHDFGGGTFGYLLKEGMENGEPAHRICANCYNKGHKSILQNSGDKYQGREKYECPNCGTKVLFGAFVEPPMAQVHRTPGRRF